MWFNHDQRVYAEAMASARQTLGIDQPAITAQTQSAGAVETPSTSAPAYVGNTSAYGSSDVTTTPVDTASLADNAPASDTTDDTTVADTSDGTDAAGAAALAATAAAAHSGQSAQTAAAQRRAGPAASQQAAANRSNQASQAAQARRRAAAHAKPEGGLFARVGAFFHRVSYRHNVPNRQREEYSRP
jgi:hypothetical protein